MVVESEIRASQSRQLAMVAHLVGIANFLFGFVGLIGSIVLYVTSKDDPFVRANAREALNMQITLGIYTMIFFVAYVVLFFANIARFMETPTAHHASGAPDLGWFAAMFGVMGMMILGFIVSASFNGFGARAAMRGNVYRYPLAIRFLRE
jgi:uncharacterized Tic20 family protein